MSRTAKEIETTGLPCEVQNGETIQVVPKVDVTMFGKFTLKQEGMEVPHAVSLTGRSRRLWTLTAYLILNRNRGVSAQELIDLLWPCLLYTSTPVSYTHLTLPTICSV